jgi:cbb3-type cytochrome oxidase subunit 3
MAYGMKPNVNIRGDFNLNRAFKWVGLSILIIIIILVLYFVVYKRIKEAVDKAKENKGYDDELQDAIQETGEQPTLTNAQALNIANDLENAMKGLFTWWSAVEPSFNKILNQADWILVKKKFGTRNGDNLYTWISDDFFMNEVKANFASKGINY